MIVPTKLRLSFASLALSQYTDISQPTPNPCEFTKEGSQVSVFFLDLRFAPNYTAAGLSNKGKHP